MTEEHKLQASEYEMLKKIFGPKWDAVSGEFRILHDE
jgi:hypothetical protein